MIKKTNSWISQSSSNDSIASRINDYNYVRESHASDEKEYDDQIARYLVYVKNFNQRQLEAVLKRNRNRRIDDSAHLFNNFRRYAMKQKNMVYPSIYVYRVKIALSKQVAAPLHMSCPGCLGNMGETMVVGDCGDVLCVSCTTMALKLGPSCPFCKKRWVRP